MKKILARRCIIAITVLLSAAAVQAQSDSTGSVIFVKDMRVDMLVKKQAQVNKVSGYKSSNGQYKGFRILILNTNNRDLAYKTRTEMLRQFPDQNVYLAYQSPYFKLKMGDFLKREDAEKIRKKISAGSGQDVFIIPDLIKIKPEDEARLLETESVPE